MSHAPASALARRHGSVRTALSLLSLDALVVTALPNVQYLTNFSGSAGIVVITRGRLLFITDFRYVTAVNSMRGAAFECPDLELVTVQSAYDASLAEVIRSLSAGRVGFEAAHLSVARFNWLKTAVGADAGIELVPTEGIVERSRSVKDGYELSVLREAGQRLALVVTKAIAEVQAGRTERDVAQAIDRAILGAGFEKPAFDTIVASGPNSALPHATPGERRLTEGDLVVLDFGGVYDSYCVDLTRTVSIGKAGSRAREVYHAVLAAHDDAIRAVRPGVQRFGIDRAARQRLEAAGMAEAFGHSTGHGLGLEVHEDPKIARFRAGVDAEKPDEAVQPSMVFTIEPGAYYAGWGGVRIEDDVVVTDDGVEVLTRAATTELIEL